MINMKIKKIKFSMKNKLEKVILKLILSNKDFKTAKEKNLL